MKKILITLVAILLLGGGVLVFALFNANALIARFKPELERVASEAVGTPVRLGALHASVFPKVSIKAREFSLGDEDQNKGLSLGELVLELKLLPLLQSQLDIDKLVFERPKVVLVKTGEGVSVVGLPRSTPKADKRPEDSTTTSPSSPKTPSTKKEGVPLAINLRQVAITEGEIVFDDQTKPQKITVSNLNFTTALALTNGAVTASAVKVSGEILGKGSAPIPFGVTDDSIGFDSGRLSLSNLSVQILNQVLVIRGEVDTKTMTGKVTVGAPSPLSIKAFDPLIEEFAPAVKAFGLAGGVRPDLNVTLADKIPTVRGTISLSQLRANAGDKQITEAAGVLKVAVNSEGQRLSSENLSMLVNGVAMKLNLDASIERGVEAFLRTLTINAFSGTTEVKGRFNLETKKFGSDLTITGTNITEILQLAKPDLASLIAGTITSIETKVSGSLGDNLIPSLAGNGRYRITEAKLVGINLAAEVLKAVNNLPLVSGSLYALLPPEVERKIGGSDTPIELLEGDFSLQGGELNPTRVFLKSTVFSLDAQGKVGFDKTVDLRSTITFSPELSAALALKAKDLQRIYDAQGRLTFPLVIKGTLPKVLVLPDLQKLLQNAGRRVVEEKGAEVLDRVLGGKKGGKDMKRILGF